ncbi:hypothetical protein FOQG_19620 [Fusarium oxysporum f. sp. raphani 54005]|uniref:Uncharacterized protein n=1 Tax=Fusarium oxysporum f. sp. raphani 54005 TaxID=1089458 RepID=X0B9W2_FUSOX|nr:hypothetical protein FOQG_19620 [Fusarium oxysporum f. sp. raphani 54005]
MLSKSSQHQRLSNFQTTTMNFSVGRHGPYGALF